MIFELDDYLDQVDEWKFKLYRKLKRMTSKQQADFWKKSQDKARNLGLPVLGTREVKSIASKKKRSAG
jgi:hypothetical protein